MKKIFAVVVLLAVGFSSHSQSKKAFVITIGDYPAQNQWSDLSSGKDKEIVIVNESPTLVEDSVEGLKLYKKM